MNVEIIHIVLALAGTALGWYLRHRSPPATPTQPDELQIILAAVEGLFSRKKEEQAHSLLQDLVGGLVARREAAPK